MDRPCIGLIGFGAFGRLAGACLASHVPTLVHDPAVPGSDIEAAGASPASLEDAAACDVCIMAVPVQAIERVCLQIAPLVRPGTLIVDVASIKIGPTETMRRLLPPHNDILGTHPLFGPQTVAEVGLRGQAIALCPVRIDRKRLETVRAFLAGTLGLRVVETTPDEHDRQMALVQGITHLIGHAARAMNLPELPLTTLAYQRLLQMKHNVERDSTELFEAIQTLNPYAAEARRRFVDAVCRTDEQIRGKARGPGNACI